LARFLIDESLPRAVTRVLASAGHEALDARDAGLRGQPDDEVAGRAAAEGRIVVTADLDFSNALRFPPGTHPGIVVARLPADWSPDVLANRIVTAVADAGPRLVGAIAIIEASRVRLFGSRTP
jgi:predicted nuclease of predicted toxin-antitoxin system